MDADETILDPDEVACGYWDHTDKHYRAAVELSAHARAKVIDETPDLEQYVNNKTGSRGVK